MSPIIRTACSCFLIVLMTSLVMADDEIDESKLKVPADAKDQMKFIERKWNSTREKEQQTVIVCARRLKESVPGDEDLQKKFLSTFEGFKEKCADEALADALKKAKVTPLGLRKEFEKLREPALQLIESNEYTEKDKNKLQPDVDTATKPLFQIWREPMTYCIEAKSLDLAEAKKIDELVKMLGEIDESVAKWPEGIENCEAYMRAKGNEQLDVTYVEYKAQGDWLEKNKTMEIDGITDEDREHVRILNDYRMMMGRKMVQLHPMLCEATRRHSEWMAKTGKMGHDFPEHPDGPSPSDRALRAGFRGKVFENCTSAKDADTAVWRMYKAAEHHKNMLRASHNTVGVGHSGSYWTENFSPDDS
ncbi:MAG: CAP domain-containing protein [Planctomycetes bacterium]|nr:CAP domain-containing protein [Planctomycetota bacterium]